ncbi:MAG: type I-E CRISPR-associated protein Cse1/CasA [Chloroflexi bacterium]|nr:type I-E CRISPR-associated protein Cse1/CasA [Chloroflexota bacterium]
MTVSFNLLNDKWIPVLRRAGKPPELLSLRETLNYAPAWLTIHASSPLTTAALYRLCLAVLHAGLRGPENPKQWKKWWNDKRWDKRLDVYLDEWTPRFELFGKHAFWQVKEGVLDKDDAAMFLEVGVDRNMGTLFDHRTALNAAPLSLPQAAQRLVMTQTFKLGGGVSRGGFKNFTHAPWASGIVFFAEGDTLFETLTLNLVEYPLRTSVFKYQSDNAKEDIPVWEREDPFKRKHDTPRGYVDYLTWPSRRIRLLPPVETEEGWRVTRVQFAQGLALPKGKNAEDALQDPAKCNRINEKPKGTQQPVTPLRFESGRALWRDSSMLYDWRDKNLHRPHVCNWISVLANETGVIDHARSLRLMGFGMAIGDQAANILFARAERLPLAVSFLSNEGLVSALSDVTKMANDTGEALERALYKLASGLADVNYNPFGGEKKDQDAEEKPRARKAKNKKEETAEEEEEQDKKPKADEKLVKLVNAWGVDARFWDALESEFEKLVWALDHARDDEQGRDAARVAWQHALRQTAFQTFDLAQEYAGDSAGALHAGVDARGYLAWQLGRILPQMKSVQEEELDERRT